MIAASLGYSPACHAPGSCQEKKGDLLGVGARVQTRVDCSPRVTGEGELEAAEQ